MCGDWLAIAPANTFVGTGSNTAGPGHVSGTIHLNDPPPPSATSAMAAEAAVTVTYNDLAGRTAGSEHFDRCCSRFRRTNSAPGVYTTIQRTPRLAITGNVTLDGDGDPNAVWIFQIASTLTTASQ